jgi:flagellar biosynthesis component FlhA
LACSLIEGVGPYRRLDSAWARIYDDTGDAPELRAELSEARMALVGALEDALGMSGAAEDQLPIVTPLVLELGSAVVPLVDPAQDNGHFLDELVPAMRDRIASTTGVTVPGVRARVNEALKPVEFSIQVDETPVSTTTLNPEGTYVVSRDNPPDGWFTDVHPLTGQRGVWTIRERSPGDDGAGEVLTAADVLIHHIERVVRENLRRYLGPEEVSGLVAGWKESEPDLVAATLPEPDDELRLTWLLQDMVDDLIPLTDGPAILNGIIAANGLRTPTRSLHRVLRSNFAHWLPGPAEGLTAVSILAEHDAALSEGTAPIVELEFRQWLHESVTDLGPNLAIVAANADARERADIWARAEHPLIRTLTTDELSLQAAVSRPAESVAER